MVMCWALNCSHYSVRHLCQFFGFPKEGTERKKWIELVGRSDEPTSGARLCSCHFIDGNRNNAPTLLIDNSEVMVQTKVMNHSKAPLKDPLESSQTNIEPPTNSLLCTEELPNENGLETNLLSYYEAARKIVSTYKEKENSSSIKQTIELIQKGNPHVETIFVDSGSEDESFKNGSDTDDAPETECFDQDPLDFGGDGIEKTSRHVNKVTITNPTEDLRGILKRPLSVGQGDYGEVSNASPIIIHKVPFKHSSSLNLNSGVIEANASGALLHKNYLIIPQDSPGNVPILQSLEHNVLPEHYQNSVGNSKPQTAPNKPAVYQGRLSDAPPVKDQQIAQHEPPDIIASSNVLEFSINNQPNCPKKYLVIPPNVLPKFSGIEGPVSLKIPGIGPVLVRNPADICKSAGYTRLKPYPTIAERTWPQYDPLKDQKFRCWRYRQNLKRDLEGYSYNDRLGFYQAELNRSTSCAKKLKVFISQLDKSIHVTKTNLLTLQTLKYGRQKVNPFAVGTVVRQLGKKGNKECLQRDLSKSQKKNHLEEHPCIQKTATLQEHSYSMSLPMDARSKRNWLLGMRRPNRNAGTPAFNGSTGVAQAKRRKRGPTKLHISPLPVRTIIEETSERIKSTAPEASDLTGSCESELLITKKVVILKDDASYYGYPEASFEIEPKQKLIYNDKTVVRRPGRPRTKQPANEPPVKKLPATLRQQKLDGKPQHKRLPGRPRKVKLDGETQFKRLPGRPKRVKPDNKAQTQRSPGRPKLIKPDDKTRVEKKPGRPGKLKRRRIRSQTNMGPDDASHLQADIKFTIPCYVDLSSEGLTQDYLQTLEEFYNDPKHAKIINNLREFQDAVDISKPILVVNKKQWTSIDFAESSCTNNIVYPVSEVADLPPWVGLSALAYNIKFAKPDILCKYLSGERDNDSDND